MAAPKMPESTLSSLAPAPLGWFEYVLSFNSRLLLTVGSRVPLR